MRTRIRFIINPISGVGKKGIIPGLIERHLDMDKFDYDIVFTEYRKHAKEIAYQSTKEHIDIVCAVGGDGSVHEVGTALIGTKTKLAIIPTGSGNGLARHLNIPLNVEKAIQNINEMNVMQMDTVLVNDKPFLNAGGYGFDALYAKKYEEKKKLVVLNHKEWVLRELLKDKRSEVCVEVNGQISMMSVMLCTRAYSSEFGDVFCVSP